MYESIDNNIDGLGIKHVQELYSQVESSKLSIIVNIETFHAVYVETVEIWIRYLKLYNDA